MTEQTLGVGIVGFGFMGKTHAWAYENVPYFHNPPAVRTRLVGVCARSQRTLAQARARHGFELATGSLDELLARDDVHIVSICTPNQAHREQIVAAIEAGKHVYVDKPLALDAAECDAIVAALDRSPKRLATQMAVQLRYYPATMRARQLIEEGRIGRVLSFRGCFLHASLNSPKRPFGWRQRPGKGGGTLYDIGSHVVDMLDWLVGPFEAVVAASHVATPTRHDPAIGRDVGITADDHTSMLLRLPGGAVGAVEASKLATGANDEMRIEIHGDKGALRLNLIDPNWLEFYDATEPDQPQGGLRGYKRIESLGRYPEPFGGFIPEKFNIGWTHGHVACVHRFLQAVVGQAEPAPDFREAARVHRVLDAAYDSHQTGAWVTL